MRGLARVSICIAAAAGAPACLSDIPWRDYPDAGAGGAASGSSGHAGAANAAGSGAAPGGDAGVVEGDGGVPGVSLEDAGGTGSTTDPGHGCGPAEDCLVPTPLLVPAPCAGVPYAVPLVAPRGTPPHVWSLSSGTSEFALRTIEGDGGAAATLLESVSSAGPSVGGVLQLEVRDSSEPPKRQTLELDLSLRESCWFAYLSGDAPTRLHLRDVFLSNDIVLAPEPDAPALDFEFSPDGRWLAFRLATASGQQLYIQDARQPASAARTVPLACDGAESDAGAADVCDAVDYAWSADSRQLAFVSRSGGRDALSGLSGFDAVAGPGAPWPARTSARWVDRDVPLEFREQLVWIGPERVAFFGPELSSGNPDLPLALYVAAVDATAARVEVPEGVPPLLTGAETTLRPRADGVVLVEAAADSESSLVVFYPAGGPALYFSGWLSPSGSAVAWTDEGDLEIYDVHDENVPVASFAADQAVPAGCESVVAWSDPIGAPPVERIACTFGGDVIFFEYDAGAATLQPIASVAATPAPSTRRAFSPSGRWFTFGKPGGTSFGLIDLASATPRVDPTPIQLSTAPVELLYPPNRGGVVNLADVGGLAEYPLPGSSSWPSAFTSAGASPRSACTEALWLAPASWCGAPRAARHLAYAPDGASLLFEDAPAQLRIAHPPASVTAEAVTGSLAACAGDCSRPTYAFQP